MQAFAYTAYTANGRRKRGTLVAESEGAAVRRLQAEGLLAETLAPRGRSGTAGAHRGRGALDADEQAVFARQMAILLEADLPLEAALGAVAAGQAGPGVGSFCARLSAATLEGTPLSQAIGHARAGFPPAFTAALSAGESTGQLGAVFATLADYQEAQTESKSTLAAALVYPAIVAGLSLLVCAILVTQVAPELMLLFEASGQPLPGITRFLLEATGWLLRNGLGLALACGACFAAGLAALRRPAVRDAAGLAALRLPLVGALRRDAMAAAYLRTLALVLTSRQTPLAAAESAAAVLGIATIRAQAQGAAKAISEGHPLAQALARIAILPPVALQLLQAGEASARLAPMASRAALLAESSLERRRKRLIAVLDPMLMILVGAAVLFVTLAVLLPIFDLQAAIQL